MDVRSITLARSFTRAFNPLVERWVFLFIIHVNKNKSKGTMATNYHIKTPWNSGCHVTRRCHFRRPSTLLTICKGNETLLFYCEGSTSQLGSFRLGIPTACFFFTIEAAGNNGWRIYSACLHSSCLSSTLSHSLSFPPSLFPFSFFLHNSFFYPVLFLSKFAIFTPSASLLLSSHSTPLCFRFPLPFIYLSPFSSFSYLPLPPLLIPLFYPLRFSEFALHCTLVHPFSHSLISYLILLSLPFPHLLSIPFPLLLSFHFPLLLSIPFTHFFPPIPLFSLGVVFLFLFPHSPPVPLFSFLYLPLPPF